MNFDEKKKKLVMLISKSQHSFNCQILTVARFQIEYDGSDALNRSLARYASSAVAPYPLGFIHLDLDG